MKITKKQGNRAVSTVFGSILFLILFASLLATLFVALYDYNKTAEASIALEKTRSQEKIDLQYLTVDSENNIDQIRLINLGSVTVQIRAIYIDDQYICDPSTYMSTSVGAQQSLFLQIIPTQPYVPTSKLCVATDRGTRSIEYEHRLKGEIVQVERPQSNFGPLAINYDKFYYGRITGNHYPANPGWIPGWTASSGINLVWRISVNNTINKGITLNEYSCFTMVPTVGSSAQTPWYMEKVIHQDGTISSTIAPNEKYVEIIYRYKTPLTDEQKITYPAGTLSNVFLTFYGVFNELDGTVKPYGQTIPFEAVRNS